MNVAEVLLRLGCGLVAWLVVFTHLIWLATLRVTGCDADGDQLWRLLLGFAAFTVGFSLLLNITRKLRGVHDILRWFAAPAVLLLPLAIPPVWDAAIQATLAAEPICSSTNAAAAWHPYWAPVQAVVLGFIIFGTWRAWRKAL